MDSLSLSAGGGGNSSNNVANSAEAQEAFSALNAMILQLLNARVNKVCFDKCLGSKFGSSMSKGDQVCVAKCMDRMYEAHAIVVKASAEMAHNLNA